MADPLRLGIVGANPTVGWAPRTHLPALLALPEYDLAAVCTTKRESAEASAAKYEARRAYWDYRDLVADPEIDVVDVCVRVPYHHEIVMAAIEAGKHVYCEWPLAATVAQAEEMAATASRKGLHAMVGLQSHGSPSVIRVRQLIADGWIGRVVSATMTHFGSGLLSARGADGAWRGDRTNGANTMTITGGHSIDALCWCVGRFTEVSAMVDTLAPEWPLEGGGTMKVTSPDYISVTGRLEGGGIATAVVASVPWHGPGFRMEVYGSEGTLVASGGQVQSVALRLQGARGAASKLVDLEIPEDLQEVPSDVPEGTPFNVAQMMRRFAASVRDGSHPEPTFDYAVRNHRLLAALERSSQSGQSVRVE